MWKIAYIATFLLSVVFLEAVDSCYNKEYAALEQQYSKKTAEIKSVSNNKIAGYQQLNEKELISWHQ